MASPTDQETIFLGSRAIALPHGVSASDWALERGRDANPRIRAFLGSIQVLDRVVESNYAILHCSPERLRQIWAMAEKVAGLVGTEIAPLLEKRSCVPELNHSLASARQALTVVSAQILGPIERLSDSDWDDLTEHRRFLCFALGELQAFLQDTLGKLLASDPRSVHDSDYYLSRRFPRDVEDAEWLHRQVVRLNTFVQELEGEREERLGALAVRLKRAGTLPHPNLWQETRAFLERLADELTPKLRETLALRGIRFEEIDSLDRYAGIIPSHCRTVVLLHDVCREALSQMRWRAGDSGEERQRSVDYLLECHDAFSRRMAELIRSIDQCLRDLAAFLPIWIRGIERRRALLLLRKGADER